MKKSILAVLALSVSVMFMTGCNAAPSVGYDAVLVDKPVIFGHGGVEPEPVKTGFTFIAPSTDVIYVSVQPIQAHVKLDDLMTSDGVPLNFDAVVRLQVTDSVQLISKFGEGWYDNNIERQVVQYTRQAVRKHGMNETAIQPTAIDDIDHEVTVNLEAYIKSINIPVKLVAFTAGKASPPDAIKTQRIETAAQQQRILTEGQKKLAEDARKNAELSRAEADNAYRNEMGLSPAQFIALEGIHMQHDVCLYGKNGCTFLNNSTGAQPILNLKD